jgi:hypothetical protein
MALNEHSLVDTFREEGSSLASAALASVTPRMINRLGGVAESTIAALDLLTSPDIVGLLSTLQKAAPTLTPLLEEISELGPGEGMQGLARRITGAVTAGADEVRAHPGPIKVGEMLKLLRQDPAMGIALRFMLGFVRSMWVDSPK